MRRNKSHTRPLPCPGEADGGGARSLGTKEPMTPAQQWVMLGKLRPRGPPSCPKAGASASDQGCWELLVPAGRPEGEGMVAGWPVGTAGMRPASEVRAGRPLRTGSSAGAGRGGGRGSGWQWGGIPLLPHPHPPGGTYTDSVAGCGAQAQQAPGGHAGRTGEQGPWGGSHVQVSSPGRGTCRGEVQRGCRAGGTGSQAAPPPP